MEVVERIFGHLRLSSGSSMTNAQGFSTNGV
jgi:hypothetical protein